MEITLQIAIIQRILKKMKIIRITIINETLILNNYFCAIMLVCFDLYLFITWSCNDILVILLIFLRNINN